MSYIDFPSGHIEWFLQSEPPIGWKLFQPQPPPIEPGCILCEKESRIEKA